MYTSVLPKFSLVALSMLLATSCRTSPPGLTITSQSKTHVHANISDVRLKKDVVRVGTHAMGFGIYRFKYLWSDTAYVGVLAQEVLKKVPHAVKTGPGDFLAVDYDALGMQMTREVRPS